MFIEADYNKQIISKLKIINILNMSISIDVRSLNDPLYIIYIYKALIY